MNKERCWWCTGHQIYMDYHDREWGVPVFENDIRMFENLVLESAQAGLSWITILKRRESYREAYLGFDPEVISRWGEEDVLRLLQNPGVIRNRKKIESSINNARLFLDVAEEFGSFSSYYWHFQEGVPIINTWKKAEDVPAVTPLAQTIAKDMKKRGFSFLGPTVTYANMQSLGMVNDHLVSCFCHKEVNSLWRKDS